MCHGSVRPSDSPPPPLLPCLLLVVGGVVPPALPGWWVGVVGACSTGYAIRNRYNFLTKRSLEEAQRHLRAFPQVGTRGAAIAEHRPQPSINSSLANGIEGMFSAARDTILHHRMSLLSLLTDVQ